MLTQTNTPRAALTRRQGFTLRIIVIAALSLIAHSSMADSAPSDIAAQNQFAPATRLIDDTTGAQAHSLETLSSQRQELLLRLQQLDQDNQRLRQQLDGVKSTDSAQAIEKVLDSHSRTIEQLRNAQLTDSTQRSVAFDPDSIQTTQAQGFHVAKYQAPAASGIDSSEAINEGIAHQSAASMWALEVAGASGVLALFGALVLLFVITVLRKSYWMPRKKLAARASARVSERGLAADLAAGYGVRDNSDVDAIVLGGASESELDIADPETIRKDQLAMAKILEQGLQLSEDDMALVGAEFEAQPSSTNEEESTFQDSQSKQSAATGKAVDGRCIEGIAGKQSLSDTIDDRQKAESQQQKVSRQTKNPLADQYNQLGGDFSSGFDDDFDELFDEAAKVSEAKPPEPRPHTTLKSLFGIDDDRLANPCRRSDEEVFRSIREKTCDYVAPTIEEGDYIVEEGCEDLDQYMAIQYIAPDKIELDEAKERRAMKR